MPSFIKDSLIYKIFNVFCNAFNNSSLKNVILCLINVFKDCIPYKLFIKYINKSPYFLNSVSYKIFRKLIRLLEKLGDLINKVLVRISKSSKIYEFFREKKILPKHKKNNFILVSTILTLVGYTIGCILFKKFNIFVFIIILLFSLIAINLKYVKDSIIFKFLKYLFC